MTRNRAKIRKAYITTAIKFAKITIIILALAAKISNIRFDLLRDVTRRVMTFWSHIANKLINEDKIYSKVDRFQGEKPWYPYCAIPQIGIKEYLITNTKAAMTAPIERLLKPIERKVSDLIVKSIHLALQTYIYCEHNNNVSLTARVLSGMKTKEMLRRKETHSVQNDTIKQYDGTADTDIESEADSEEEIDPKDLSNLRGSDFGWNRTGGTVCKKGIEFWCWINQTPAEKEENKESETVTNDTKGSRDIENKVEEVTEEEHQSTDTQSSDSESKEEIYINPNETCRTKILTMNVRSAVSPRCRAEIIDGVRKVDTDVVILTESWLNEYDQELRIDHWQM